MRRRSLVENQKIKTVESEIKNLKDKESKSHQAPAKTETPRETELENEIQRLREQNDLLLRDSEVRLRSLQQEVPFCKLILV